MTNANSYLKPNKALLNPSDGHLLYATASMKRSSDWAPVLAERPIARATIAICGYRVRRGGCLNRALRLAFGLRIR